MLATRGQTASNAAATQRTSQKPAEELACCESPSLWLEDGTHTRRQVRIFFCRGRLCRLIAVGHTVRHTKRTNYQQVKQMPHSVAQLPEPPSPVPPGVRR